VNINKHLQNVIPYGVFHKYGEITGKDWGVETLSKWGANSFGKWDEEGTFYLQRNEGFFSNCSVTLFELARSKQMINRVDASNAFSQFKASLNEDVWPKYFSTPILLEPKSYGYWGETLLHHNRYNMLNLKAIEPLLNSYFHPSDLVLSRQLELIKKYKIDLSKTLVVNYRGTDKWKEVAPTPIEKWVSLARTKLATLHPETRVLIQTDQSQVLDRFLHEFKDRAFHFNELPTTEGNEPIHEILDVDKREDFSINFLATTLILSNCHSVITHTGNVAFWTVLFRRHTNRLIQI
jgi:hypothetical protein